jgi:hypothetical protein
LGGGRYKAAAPRNDSAGTEALSVPGGRHADRCTKTAGADSARIIGGDRDEYLDLEFAPDAKHDFQYCIDLLALLLYEVSNIFGAMGHKPMFDR